MMPPMPPSSLSSRAQNCPTRLSSRVKRRISEGFLLVGFTLRDRNLRRFGAAASSIEVGADAQFNR